jgi:hypothetical protein
MDAPKPFWKRNPKGFWRLSESEEVPKPAGVVYPAH